ncbi:MAG: hypothetical protein NXH84_03855 [Rhodobacteraceae bacterium]|nr:hypothetical protein [Paracoccaceae bacterium]
MATLIQLSESGCIDTIDPLEEDELPWRTLYGTIAFLEWLENDLPNLDHDPMFASLSPLEQLFAAFAEYASGDMLLTDRRFKKLSCTPERFVWEIKTEDVRVFGWVPTKDTFLCCYGDSADRIKIEDSYGRYIAQTVYVRENMDLDEPKFVASGALEDVVSDKD